MRILGWISAGLVLVALLIVGGGYLLLPSAASLSRELVIAAPQERVFAMVNSFERFDDWSPWADLDPNARHHLSGPPAGEGARHQWESDNPSVGSGSQEIIFSEPPVRVQMQVRFSGFESDNLSTITLSPEAQGTLVTWSYRTDVGDQLLGRYFLLLLEGMLGPQYEKGLLRLKTLMESDSAL